MTITKFFTGVFLVGLLSSCTNEDEGLRSFDEQLAIDLNQIDTYLAENAIEANVHSPSAIRYTIIREGDGKQPDFQDSITVKYKGNLLSGAQFDSNTDGITFYLDNRLIPAWQIMLPTMQEGEKMVMYAPSVYCYGRSQVGSIPPNSSLIFEIELIGIINPED